MIDIAYKIGAYRAEEDLLEKLSGVGFKSLATAGLLGGLTGAFGSQLRERDDGSLFLDPTKTSPSAAGSGVLTGVGAMGGLALGGALRRGLLPQVIGMGVGGFAAPTLVEAGYRNLSGGY